MTEAPTDPPDDAGRNRQPGGRFQKGTSGNPRGRPKGRRNNLTVMSAHVSDEDMAGIIKKTVEAAKKGSLHAAKEVYAHCLEPKPRDPLVTFKMPKLKTADDAKRAIAAIIKATADGELTPSEARDMAALVETFARAHEIAELEERLVAIEERMESQ